MSEKEEEPLTPAQLSEWSKSWTVLSQKEYFQQKASGVPGNEHPEEQAVEVHLKQHTRTKLSGSNSILVDIGSQVNVIGEDTEKEFAATIAEYGLETQYTNRKHRLYINGVGSDAAFCDNEACMPIAVKFKEQDATVESFKANVAKGCGQHLPGILGLVSMQEKDSVLILRKGEEFLALPGAGGYSITWSPGTRLLPMKAAPSGHLIIPCDRFSELSTNKENPEQISFLTDHTRGEFAEKSASSANRRATFVGVLGNEHPAEKRKQST